MIESPRHIRQGSGHVIARTEAGVGHATDNDDDDDDDDDG